MRFKRLQQDAKLPEVNLIPMLNVMMGVLAFFVTITMTLSAQLMLEMQLPSDADDVPPEALAAFPDPLIVEMNRQEQLFIKDRPASLEQLQQEIQIYLQKNPKGSVFLKPDRQLSYETVMKILGEMEAVGRDRVSLAIE